ncbi:hypothetical protein QE152_g34803 [Popillia japonica]|uniref:Uncharacterized protein n=1 Tax=Popillia japonica TaxID=7064 RepID=A0AAW1ITJ6_POPJA
MHKMAARQFPLSMVPVCPEIEHVGLLVLVRQERENAGFVVDDGAQSLGENSDPADIDDLDDELRAWINMDEDVPVVERNFIETIARSLLTTEDMVAAEETDTIDIEGSSSTPPTSTEIHAALDVLRKSLDIRHRGK